MTPFVIAVDWGTSSFRLWVLAADGTVLAEKRSDQGMMVAREAGFDAVLERYLAELSVPPEVPVVVCGMAGAKQGWREAAYLDAPAALSDLIGRAVRVEDATRDVRILPGVAQRDPDWPDVMRGEETKLIGTVGQGISSGLVCMPGTHSKWVLLKNERIESFASFMTGEIFATITKHSILRLAIENQPEADPADPVFAQAVAEAFGKPEQVSGRIFSVRAGPLLSLRDPAHGQARLSGLLIGLELAGAQSRFGQVPKITLVTSGRLGVVYRAAFEALKIKVRMLDADLVVRSGLFGAAQALWGTRS